MPIHILGIESSCDDTAAAVIQDRKILSNIIADQSIHQKYGGVVPELASRAHQQNIVAVVDTALKQAAIPLSTIDAVAFTIGPGLLGSLMVGTSFAKGLSLARNIPLIEVNHLHAHFLVHFIENEKRRYPAFPFLTLLVSGGNTQIILVKDYLSFEIIGQTIDDAAGETFDKCAKIMGIPYPGGPIIDQLAKKGNPSTFQFSKPSVQNYDFSFSGLKTSFLYFIRKKLETDNQFIEKNKFDLSASLQNTIITILMEKLTEVAKKLRINRIALAGGVSANSGLRYSLLESSKKNNWDPFIPLSKYAIDNAAMIAINGYFKYLNNEFSSNSAIPYSRIKM